MYFDHSFIHSFIQTKTKNFNQSHLFLSIKCFRKNRPRNRTRSNRSRKSTPIFEGKSTLIFEVDNGSRYRMTHVPKVGSDFWLRKSAPVFVPVCLQLYAADTFFCIASRMSHSRIFSWVFFQRRPVSKKNPARVSCQRRVFRTSRANWTSVLGPWLHCVLTRPVRTSPLQPRSQTCGTTMWSIISQVLLEVKRCCRQCRPRRRSPLASSLCSAERALLGSSARSDLGCSIIVINHKYF